MWLYTCTCVPLRVSCACTSVRILPAPSVPATSPPSNPAPFRVLSGGRYGVRAGKSGHRSHVRMLQEWITFHNPSRCHWLPRPYGGIEAKESEKAKRTRINLLRKCAHEQEHKRSVPRCLVRCWLAWGRFSQAIKY